MSRYFLALDQGTTSSRAVVFDARCAAQAIVQHDFDQSFPRPGHVEHDAEQIFDTQWRAAREAHAQLGGPPIEAVGICNQRETVVVFDRTSGRPIHPAIVWQDRRTRDRLARLEAHAERVRELTGLPLDPYFSAAKIAHILDAVPGARRAAERGELGAATIDAWLIHRLTEGAVFATEPSNASRTSLFDLERFDWSDELCELFDVPRRCLPELRPSSGPFGEVRATGWPITGVLGDQQAALFGHGATAVGDAKCTYGTGAFWLSNVGATRPDPKGGLLATVAWQIGASRCYAIEGSILVAGALVQWLRDGLGMLREAREIEPLARRVDDSGGVVIVPAFAGLGTPHWDPDARGLIIGLTRGTRREHLARAALEALALQVDDVLAAVESSGAPRPHELHVDGGAVANDLLLEMQATISQLRVVRPKNLETTAVGACRIAMVGHGIARGDRAVDAARVPRCEIDRSFDPGAGIADRAGLRRRWRAAVTRSRGWESIARADAADAGD